MITTMYQFVNKGSWRALSFLLALALTLCFFLNIQEFSTALRSAPIYWILLVLWAVVINWIHGIGFEIQHSWWKVVFFPYIGYIIGAAALIQHFLLA